MKKEINLNDPQYRPKEWDEWLKTVRPCPFCGSFNLWKDFKMNHYFSDNAWWLFHYSIDSVIFSFFSIMVVAMVFIYAEDHKDIHSDRFYLYVWSSFTIFSVLMLALSIFICNAGYGSVDDQLLQSMNHQEKQIAKSTIEKSHHPINFFQWNEIIEKNEAIIQKKETAIENKKKMLDPKVIKELELLRN